MTRVLLVVFASFVWLSAQAQTKYGDIAGSVSIEGFEYEYINGANVQLFVGKDTLVTVADNGTFGFYKVPYGEVTLLVTHVSYTPKVIICNINKPMFHVKAELKEQSQKIKQVEVKGRMEVLSQKGDTLVYNAAAIRTLSGDETMELLRQMPGVEIEGGKVTVMGEQIARTYVDNRLTFGHDPLAALNNLKASDVLKIRVYDESADRTTNGKKRRGDAKERVLNIETKSKLVSSATAHLIASYGADIGQTAREQRRRYGIGMTANSFSEKMQITLHGYFNNLDRTSNRISHIIESPRLKKSYNRNTQINADFTRTWKTANEGDAMLNVVYVYNDDYINSQNMLSQRYFPSEQYTSRTYADTSLSSNLSRSHRSGITLMHPNVASGNLFFNHVVNFGDKRDNDMRASLSELNGTESVASLSTGRTDGNSYSLSESFDWRLTGKERYEVMFGAGAELDNGDDMGLRLDSLSSSAMTKVLETDSKDRKERYRAKAGVTYKLSTERRNDLTISYNYSYVDSRTRRSSLNMTDPADVIIDTTNTFDFTNKSATHNTELRWDFSIPKLKGELTLGAAYRNATVLRSEEFPEASSYDKDFDAILPSIYFRSRGIKSSFTLIYRSNVLLPSVEQLRDKINDVNPFVLLAGNPSLKQTYHHSGHISVTNMVGKSNSTIRVEAAFNYFDSPVVSKRTFYTEQTTLPQWANYLAPAQSTLVTYENANSKIDAKLRASFSKPLSAIKSKLTIRTNFGYEQTPSYIGQTLSRTESYVPELGVELQSNISRRFRFAVEAASQYSHNTNTQGQSDKWFETSVGAKVELNKILKRFYLNAKYSSTLYNRIGSTAPDMNSHILNAAVGCKLLGERADISVTAYDLLNRNSGFETNMYSDYVQNETSYSFGRYITFNLYYYFNRNK